MKDVNLVVSGKRLAGKLQGIEATQTNVGGFESTTSAGLADLRILVGATDDVAQPLGQVGFESTSPQLSDLEKKSIEMQIQSAVHLLEEADEVPGVFSTTENQIAAVVQSALAERAAQKEEQVDQAEGGGFEAKFDERDARWVLSLVTWIGKLKPHDWLPLPQETEKFDHDLKMAIMGDWGTGLYGAPKCTAAINAIGGFDYVIHLGDIYYSGTKCEVQSNFLDKWPKVPGSRYRACNGNHEMYSGGYGYFDIVVPEFGQTSSCFAIENNNWLIVALDSAFTDHDLANHQNAWLKQLADERPKKKLALFSHHQPFSHFESGGEKLVEKLLPLLNDGRVTAWYWGHEHRCVLYDRHPKWNFIGRCIGHSGYPYFRKPSLRFARASAPSAVSYGFWRELPENRDTGTPRAILLDGENPQLDDEAEKYGPNGFVTLEFKGETLIERHFLATGEELTSMVIS